MFSPLVPTSQRLLRALMVHTKQEQRRANQYCFQVFPHIFLHRCLLGSVIQGRERAFQVGFRARGFLAQCLQQESNEWVLCYNLAVKIKRDNGGGNFHSLANRNKLSRSCVTLPFFFMPLEFLVTEMNHPYYREKSKRCSGSGVSGWVLF